MNYPKVIKDFGGFDALSAAEQEFVEKTCAGEPCVLGDGTRPDGPSVERNIRASLIRYMALGGCEAHPTHEKGISLEGASVEGALDLELCKGLCSIGLFKCAFPELLIAQDASMEGLFLDGSVLEKGLSAQRVQVEGSLTFRGDFIAKGEVSLSGAKVGVQLSCVGAHFENEGGFALIAQGFEVSGDVLLSDGFSANAAVDLSGAKIGGQLACSSSSFENEEGVALNVQGAVIKDILFWQDVTVEAGRVVFIRAHAARIVDDAKSWVGVRANLDGFTYNTLGGTLTVDNRLDWLGRSNTYITDFQPQPYQQLAKVYGEMGRMRDRGAVLMEMENRLRASQFKDLWGRSYEPWSWFLACAHWVFGKLARYIVGYGHRPAYSLLWALGIVGLTALWAKTAWDEGSMIPDAPQVLVSAQWQKLAGPTWEGSRTPGIIWSEKTEAGQDYETFHPIAYAADLFIPLVDFGQEAAWAPSTNRAWWGRQLWWGRWFIEGFGWIVTAMGAAAITGVIRNE